MSSNDAAHQLAIGSAGDSDEGIAFPCLLWPISTSLKAYRLSEIWHK